MTDLAAASGKMHIVLQRMVARYPYHANIIAAGTFVAEPVKTMAVTVRNGRLVFLYDPRFVLAHALDVLIGALLHETGHVLADHLTADPAAYPDRRARTIAEEVTVNEWVSEPLPPGVLRHEAFGLPPNEDTDTRYGRLAAGRKKGASVPNSDASGRKVRAKNRKTARKRTDSSASVRTFDDHSVWEHVRHDAAARDVIDQAIIGAADLLSAAEWRNVPDAVRARVRDARARASAHGGVMEAVTEGVGRIRWRPLLEHVAARRRTSVANFRRPSRRHPALVGIVPSYAYQNGRLRIAGIIDTSGSIDAATLSVISAELAAIAALHTLTVVQCDDRIQSVAPFAGPITAVRGRGATDFRPPFEPLFLATLKADLVVYFCDGDGPAPLRPPAIPVIWAITPGGRTPARWGHVVVLPAAFSTLHARQSKLALSSRRAALDPGRKCE